MHHGTAIVDDVHLPTWVDESIADPARVQLEEMDAVRVDPAQIGVDERVGHDLRGGRIGTQRDEYVGAERVQRPRVDARDRVGHKSSQPGCRSARDGWRPVRIGESGASTRSARCWWVDRS
jgi:hypothetical protein